MAQPQNACQRRPVMVEPEGTPPHRCPRAFAPSPQAEPALRRIRGVRATRAALTGLLLAACAVPSHGAPVLGVADQPLGAPALQRLGSDPLVVPGRYRLARLDRDALAGALRRQEPLVLDLFADLQLKGLVGNVEELDGGSTFVFGVLDGGGHFSLLLHTSGIVRGEFHSVDGLYTMASPTADADRVLIRQEDHSDVVLCADDHEPGTDSDLEPVSFDDVPGAPPDSRGPAADARSPAFPALARGVAEDGRADETIDVLAVYTQRVEDHAGGPAQVEAAIEHEMAKTNQVLVDSALPHRQMRLAAMEKVDYSQEEDPDRGLGVDHKNLVYTVEDNYGDNDYSALDEVHELREKHEADFVHLFVRDSSTGACGKASGYSLYAESFIVYAICPGSSDPQGCLEFERKKEWKTRRSFSVSSIQCTGIYTFTHELGHSLGLWHNRDNYNWIHHDVRTEMPFRPYAFGYRNDHFDRVKQITIMDVLRKGPIYLIPYFSNPDVFFPPPRKEFSDSFKTDTPMGVPGDEYTLDLDGPVNASRAIDDVWEIVASLSEPIVYRPSQAHCEEAGTPANALESLRGRAVELPSGGGSRELTVFFHVVEGCSNVGVEARASSSFIETDVRKVQDGEFRLMIGAGPDDGSSCDAPSGEVTVEVTGVNGVDPAYIDVTQQPSNAFCLSVAELPADSVALDLSRRNRSPSLRLAGGMFSRFAELESLNLGHNRLSHFERAVFDGLDKLLELDMSHNRIRMLSDNAISSLPSLEHLDLSHNWIDAIGARALSSEGPRSHQLKTLDLSHNRLQLVADFVFERLFWLERLRLNDNRITGEIGRYAFFGLPNLTNLNLSRNELSGLGDRAFDYNGKLAALWLHSNDIARIHPDALAGLSDLRALSLSDNALTELPEGVFSGLTGLQHLWLYRNRLSHLSAGLFAGLLELKTLSLSANGLDALPDGLFSDLAALEQLWLIDNRLATISGRTFAGLANIRSLSLSGNALRNLPNGAFAELGNLEDLWLYGNDIREIQGGAFDGLANLRFLDISDNPLSERLPADVCTVLRGVETLRADGVDVEHVCP